MIGGERFRGARDKAVALVVPWLFVGIFAALYFTLLLPRAGDNALLTILSVLAGLAFVSFTVAAVTFTRDVLGDRPV